MSLLCMIVQIFPVVVQMPFPMVQTVRRTMVFPQFVLDKVIVVPVVQYMCRRGEDSRAPTVALVVDFVGAAHYRVDELIG